MGKIYYIMGKSCSRERFGVQRNPKADAGTKSDHNVHDHVPMPEGERDGVEYYFTDRDRLKKAGRGGACDRTACVQYKVRRVEIFYSE